MRIFLLYLLVKIAILTEFLRKILKNPTKMKCIL